MNQTTPEGDDVTPSETVESTVEGAENSETVAETEGKQETSSEDLQQVVAEKAFKEREARRETEQLRGELAQLKTEQEQAAQGERPAIPDLPEFLNEEEKAQLSSRDQALREAADFDAAVTARQLVTDTLNQNSADAQQKALNDAATVYSDRAKQLGISDVELQQSGQMLINSGVLTQQEVSGILVDSLGPKIAQYLSQNLVELNKLAELPVGSFERAAAASEIRQKASALKTKTTETPDPPEEIRSGGIPIKRGGFAALGGSIE